MQVGHSDRPVGDHVFGGSACGAVGAAHCDSQVAARTCGTQGGLKVSCPCRLVFSVIATRAEYKLASLSQSHLHIHHAHKLKKPTHSLAQRHNASLVCRPFVWVRFHILSTYRPDDPDAVSDGAAQMAEAGRDIYNDGTARCVQLLSL